MWYGYPKLPNLSKNIRLKKQRNNQKRHAFGKYLSFRDSYPSQTSSFYVPKPWNLVVLRPVAAIPSRITFYLYCQSYFFNITSPAALRRVHVDPMLNVITFSHHATPYCYRTVLRSIQASLALFQRPFFKKIRFRGKGYYMYKNARQTIAPQFGYAHRVYVYAQANSVKFLSKTKILLFGLSELEIHKAAHSLKRTKPMNIFTGRGVRFARQVVYRKTGKVSSYR